MEARPVFPAVRSRAGMYESFYLRAFSPVHPLGIWIRHTVHKRPGAPPKGSVWCTIFDGRRPSPVMAKTTSLDLSVPEGGWISIAGSTFGPGEAEGRCGQANWALRFSSQEATLHHLSPEWLYGMPLPRTKLTSPAPTALFEGSLVLEGNDPILIEGWPGMVGHNWGSEHAERWIWLHGAAFSQEPDAWMDVALGRILVAGHLTPWVANGVLSLEGVRHRLGGLLHSRPRVAEGVTKCSIELKGAGGVEVGLRTSSPDGMSAGWRYADPDGGEHDVVNCSVAGLELEVHCPGRPPRRLSTEHGGAYELGMRERDHGIPIAPFSDG